MKHIDIQYLLAASLLFTGCYTTSVPGLDLVATAADVGFTAPSGERSTTHETGFEEVSFPAHEAAELSGELTTDAYAHDGLAVRVSPASKLFGETVLSGLGATFNAGFYAVTFYLRTEGGIGSPSTIAELAVARRRSGTDEPFAVTEMRTVTGAVFSREDIYTPVTLRVKLAESEELDFRVRYIGNAVLYIDRITITPAGRPEGK